MTSRRKFIKTVSTGSLLLAFPGTLTSCSHRKKNLKDIGIQLYTLRDVMPADPVGVLKQVAAMGYTQIESYEGDRGMFWGMDNRDFSKLMGNLGMKIISSHTDIHKEFERKAALAAEIDMHYLVCPWAGAQKTLDDYKRLADLFNEKGRVCRENGIRFAYHNHEYTFLPVEGSLPHDILMTYTDPDLVTFEMDVYWVVTAGEDPVHWLKKYPGRWRLSHIKDRKKNIALTKTDATCVLGTGEIDWPRVLKTAVEEGMEFFFVEQEQYDKMSSMDAARLNAGYLKNLAF